MDMKLEVVVVPVSDVDRARDFYQTWVSFSDPDGNTWFVQEVTTRRPGRTTSALAVKYEEETGQPDPDWPGWYTQYLANETAGQDAGA
jgi:catechol 2,3-dioxygenase-like lactoylglutathione lyase family enzyme